MSASAASQILAKASIEIDIDTSNTKRRQDDENTKKRTDDANSQAEMLERKHLEEALERAKKAEIEREILRKIL